MIFEFCGKTEDTNKLSDKKWLQYLYLTRENKVNLERVDSISDIGKENYVLRYAERTLTLLDGLAGLSERAERCVRTTLEWAEVAKCGMPEQRTRWGKEGFNLEIHNEASADIYKQEAEVSSDRELIYLLIRTHGLLGQYIRGESNFAIHQVLTDCVKHGIVTSEELREMLMALNYCVIAGVNEELWELHKNEVIRLIDVICYGDPTAEKEDLLARLKKIFIAFRRVGALTEAETELYEKVLADNDLWYVEGALETFSREEINTIFSIIAEKCDHTEHISFYRFAENLNYDFEGRRKVNVYKKRIIELCLRELKEGVTDKSSSEHAEIQTVIEGTTMYFNVKFTPVCASLVNFCVEAERSGIMTYERSIQTIFDMFGFRRDMFDRLNNEEQYLQTMNEAEKSTKANILDYVMGKSVVDVGSGGGVLLDQLEKRYPDSEVIGTDISANVIETLENKIQNEGHHYKVIRHNFVEGKLDKKVDSIIFSSIIHEIYSYTEMDGHRFNLAAVKAALKNAIASLTENGRIIIRDGVMCDRSRVGSIRFVEKDGVTFCKNYMSDFGGLEKLRVGGLGSEWDEDKVRLDGDILTASPDFIREALYTYTWGPASYAQEVMEQFGYLSFEDYKCLLEELGLKIIYSQKLTEPGYPEHLEPKVELLGDLTWDELPSTCIIIGEKN